MLTNIFYYNSYKPYILKSKSVNKINSYKKVNKIYHNTKSNGSQKFSFFLNRALKDEIINYAGSISNDLNSIKNASKAFLMAEQSNIGIDSDSAAGSNGRQYYDNLFKELVSKCNYYKSFSQNASKNSPALNAYEQSLDCELDNYHEALENMGVEFLSDNQLGFNEEKSALLDGEQYEQGLYNLKPFFSDLYNKTCDIMSLPMLEHMNFKELDYYYNYTYDTKDRSSFKLIETGLLVDIIL